jgi:hypothetical protein
MGRYNEETGKWEFTPGYGSGPDGAKYEATIPMGKFGAFRSGTPPYWTQDPQRRLHVLVQFFEERAKFTGLLKKRPRHSAGSLEQRLAAISEVLEEARQDEMKKLAGRNDRLSFTRLSHLRKTGRFTEWVQAILRDYYFDAADDPNELTPSWDAGQCAYRHGGVDKIFVKQLLRQINKIGMRLYPAPEMP